MTWDLSGSPNGLQPPKREPVRILFISHDAGMFGAQRTLLTFLSEIDRRAYAPLLVVPYDGPLNRRVAMLGIPVFVERLIHWVPGSKIMSRRQRLGHLYRFLQTLYPRCRAIERLIEDQEVDVVYTNTVTCIEGAIAARRKRKPHVWHIHEPILRNSELTPVLPIWLYCGIIKFLSKSIIFCSRALTMNYPQFSSKASLVYNGLPIPQIRDRLIAKANVMNHLGIDADTKLVAVVGALHPRKDHMNFLAAAEHVVRRIKEGVFLIVGSGSENMTNLIRQRIRDLRLETRVRLMGWWQGDIHDLLAAIDVLVISSEQESFGLTAIEALAVETPVVSTRCGGPEEILLDGETGMLVPVKDPQAMANAIVSLLQDPKHARRLAISGRKHVSDQFGVDRYVQGIQRIIQTAVTVGGNDSSVSIRRGHR